MKIFVIYKKNNLWKIFFYLWTKFYSLRPHLTPGDPEWPGRGEIVVCSSEGDAEHDEEDVSNLALIQLKIFYLQQKYFNRAEHDGKDVRDASNLTEYQNIAFSTSLWCQQTLTSESASFYLNYFCPYTYRVMISLCFLSLYQCIWCLALESIKVLLDNLKIFQTKLLLVAWETPIYRSSFSTNFFVRAESPVRAVTSAVVWQKNLMKCQSAICRVWHLSLCSSACHNRIITNNNVQLGFKYHQPCSGEVLSVFGRENGGVLA